MAFAVVDLTGQSEPVVIGFFSLALTFSSQIIGLEAADDMLIYEAKHYHQSLLLHSHGSGR